MSLIENIYNINNTKNVPYLSAQQTRITYKSKNKLGII